MNNVKKSWLPILNQNLENILEFLDNCNYQYVPKKELIFDAFKFFEVQETKYVLLGQDPYINTQIINNKEISQAMGLSFSVPKEFKIPPSLKNIYKEIKNSYPDFIIPDNGDLTFLAKNNWLLLNSALTTKKGKSNFHKKLWSKYTDNIIKFISDNSKDVTFILLGNFAKKKAKLIDGKKHKIILGVHPSPLSAYKGFFNSGIFDNINISNYNK